MGERESFRRSLADRLSLGDSTLSPEECPDLWRAQEPSEHEPEAGAPAIREAIDDMRAGDAGRPLPGFLSGFRTGRSISS
jgi:hypothetical protein